VTAKTEGPLPIVIGISGASGSIIAKATVDELLQRDIPVALVCTNDARLVWQDEMDEPYKDVLSRWREHPHFVDYSVGDTRAPIASGTYPTRGMVVVPSSMSTVAGIAHGMANNLLLRAADVCLKEGRKLVVVPRETPLHAIHLENLLTLARMGAVVLPPAPAFYLRPSSIDDMVGFFVRRIMVAAGVDEDMGDEYQYAGPAA
jgi:4-hydroxy-3-polyprenylbenzoate decarboxylase